MSDFDDPIDRRGTHALKWDMMQARYGVPPRDGAPRTRALSLPADVAVRLQQLAAQSRQCLGRELRHRQSDDVRVPPGVERDLGMVHGRA